MQPRFIHLHLHTEYSIIDGLGRIDDLIQTCVNHNIPAVAITDQCNFFGLIKFYQAAIRAGIKPIIGTDILISADDKKPQTQQQAYSATLLCQNQQGYKNIIQLISRAYTEGQRLGVPIISRAWLEDLSAGIIVLSGGRKGDIGQALLANNLMHAKQLLTWWNKYFSARFYLELQRTNRVDEELYLNAAINFANEYSIPVVATNDVRFISRDDFEAHEARTCIHDGYILEDSKRPRNYSEQQYLRSAEEMQQLFTDIPEALENTVEIAKRCNLTLTLGEVFLPKFPVPSHTTVAEYFTAESKQGLAKRNIFAEQQAEYAARLQYELDIINQMGFAGYFLIVADFIHWAKQNDIPVGPGRGSGAGSLVAYALNITDLDPIEHKLLFERFLNPERVSMPDFDIDFCMEGRDRVIDYVAERYGRLSVAQIITYGTMAAKAVVRDVGRVLGYPYGYVDKIAKLIPFELGITLEKALQQEDILAQQYKTEEEVKTLIDLALKLEGLTRNAGKHAGGVVISPSLLTDFTPIYCEENGQGLVTQFDKGDIEIVGLVKFDFLGLRTLTIINWAIQTVNANRHQLHEELLDITKIPLDDKETYKLLRSCATTAIFQLESRGMRDLVKRLKPDCFNDIVALVALFRPGPLQSGMVDDFIERKHGRAVVRYPHPELESILNPTYGVILYQEQVMQIAQILAGYSLGAADLLRRAMGKKKPEEMAKHRAIFMEGAVKRGVDKHVANGIFDLMEKFAGYGFNKSHSAGYALIAYQTAWLKTHYPAEFMAAVLSSDMDNTDKVAMFVAECKRMELCIISPDVNRVEYKFTVTDNGEIIYGLGAIKGVGEAAVDEIVTQRNKGDLFKDLFELCRRADTRKVNKRVLEALIRSGAMDNIGPSRARQFASIQNALKAAEQYVQHQARGQGDFFAELLPEDKKIIQIEYTQANEWSDIERLQGEHETLGLYLTGHPIEQHEKELAKFITAQLAELDTSYSKTVIVAGFVSAIKTLITKSGKHMAVVTLEDCSGRMEITIFSEAYLAFRHLLIKGELLIIEGDLAIDDFTGSYRVQARNIYNILQAREEYSKYLLLKFNEQQLQENFIHKLTDILQPFQAGKCFVYVDYSCQGAGGKLLLGDEWSIHPTDEVLIKLQEFLGVENVRLIYNQR